MQKGASSLTLASLMNAVQNQFQRHRFPLKENTMTQPANVSAKAILDLLKRQRFRCALSGRKLSSETAEVDYVVPICRGGKEELGNLIIVDRQVSMARGVMNADEFITLCQEVVNHVFHDVS